MTAAFPDPLATPLIPGPRDEGVSVLMLHIETIDATIRRPSSRPAKHLFAELSHRGAGAWREAALLLIQHTCAASDLEPGPDGAATYLMRQDPADALIPCIEAVGRATVAYIRDGEQACRDTLAATPVDCVRDAARHLFCVAMTGKISPQDLDDITGEMLADIYLGGLRTAAR